MSVRSERLPDMWDELKEQPVGWRLDWRSGHTRWEATELAERGKEEGSWKGE